MREADNRTGIVCAAASGTCKGTRATGRSVLACVVGFQYSRRSLPLCFRECHDAPHAQFTDPDAPAPFLRPLLGVIAILLLAKAALGFLTGWGLLQREKWARILALMLAFVSLFTNIPFGTALGVYTMWVLLPQESE